ncbi:MSHA biogenesis protein MshA [Vibrio sp. CAU 1672]|uniref:MSHA biogenesis protein MshA n=1 Tax=Vibrio sp. CAU 1672 TaxID=3032594 RepID=UPI0023DA7C48|nr:MSHA biogenesis protein MshA [Vibrio sp. CAU 1672]MDF2155630.1 MSHA biogenesis protein MshA [Vibrio sp. CAU 1672]
MRQSSGLSTTEFIVLLTFFAVAGYVLLPRFISIEPEMVEATWQETKHKAEQVTETLSNKATYDRIEQELGRGEDTRQ